MQVGTHILLMTLSSSLSPNSSVNENDVFNPIYKLIESIAQNLNQQLQQGHGNCTNINCFDNSEDDENLKIPFGDKQETQINHPWMSVAEHVEEQPNDFIWDNLPQESNRTRHRSEVIWPIGNENEKHVTNQQQQQSEDQRKNSWVDCKYVANIEGAVVSKTCDEERPSGGSKPAKSKEYPFMSKIIFKRMSICEGAIIDKEWILTSAHCFAKSNSSRDITVAVGLSSFGSRIKNEVPAQQVFIYPEYGPNNLFADIALIKLSRPLTFSRKVGSIPISLNEDLFGEVRTVGWTYHFPDHAKVTKKLYYAKSVILNDLVCKSYLYTLRPSDFGNIKNNVLCVSNMFNKDECFGGVSSPLVQHTGRGPVLVGLKTIMPGCSQHQPVIFVKVSSFLEWVSEITGIDFEEVPEENEKIRWRPVNK